MKILLATLLFCLASGLSGQVSVVDRLEKLGGLPQNSLFEGNEGILSKDFVGQAEPYVFALRRYEMTPGVYAEGEAPFDGVMLQLFVFTMPDEVVYNGPVTLQILDHGIVIHSVDREASDGSSLYGVQYPLPEAGKLEAERFSLRVVLPGAGGLRCTIPFWTASQVIPWARWYGIGFAVLFFMILAFVMGWFWRKHSLGRGRAGFDRCKPSLVMFCCCFFAFLIAACGRGKPPAPALSSRPAEDSGQAVGAGAVQSWPATRGTEGGDVLVTVMPSGGTIPLNEHFSLEVSLAAAEGSELGEGLRIAAGADMPGHGHGMLTKPETATKGRHRFRVDGMLLHMAGDWVITVDVSGAEASGRASFPVVID